MSNSVDEAKESLNKVSRLVLGANSAFRKMGLNGEGGNLRLSHEVRIMALALEGNEFIECNKRIKEVSSTLTAQQQRIEALEAALSSRVGLEAAIMAHVDREQAERIFASIEPDEALNEATRIAQETGQYD